MNTNALSDFTSYNRMPIGKLTHEFTRVSVTDAAKLIRQDLKTAFPSVKFSVRCKQFAHGASITIEWDGDPLVASVEQLVDHYRGVEITDSDYAELMAVEIDGRWYSFSSDYINYRRHGSTLYDYQGFSRK